VVVLLGRATPGLAGSAYSTLAGAAVEDGTPGLDLALERALQSLVRIAAERGLLASAQDVSGGGLAVALAESAMWGGEPGLGSGDRSGAAAGIGARLRIPVAHAPAVELFGESPSRVVVSLRPGDVAPFLALAAEHDVPATEIGSVGGDRLVVELARAGATGAAEERGARVADAIDVRVADLAHAWDHGLSRALGWEGG
jgi:phosphoribosylformylglycinamidine synthase